jgi:hypothetical protein
MSVEQYQRSVNSLDKDIAGLEKKKAEADKKCAIRRRLYILSYPIILLSPLLYFEFIIAPS